jgi:hypothetical protein
MRDDTDFVRRSPPDGEGFLEIQGRLSVQPGARLDPVALPEIRARISGSTPGAKPKSAVAVGVSIAMCRYLSPETRVREVSRMAVGKDGGLGVSRDSASAPLKLTLEGPTVDLCIAFAGPARAGDSVSLEFGGRAFTVSLPEPPKPVVSVAKTDAEKGLGLACYRRARLRSPGSRCWCWASGRLRSGDGGRGGPRSRQGPSSRRANLNANPTLLPSTRLRPKD